jgi:O-antigen ligase
VGSSGLNLAQHFQLAPLSVVVFSLVLVLAAALTRWRPAYGIACVLALEPFDWAHYAVATQVTLGKAALLGVLVALAAGRTSLAPLRAPAVRPIVAGALALTVATALTVIPATYLDATAREILKALEYLALFGAAAVAVRNEDDETAVVRAVTATAAVVCVLALAQFGTKAPSAVILGTMVVPRVAGPLEGPNQLAGYLDLIVPLLLVRSLVARDFASRAVLVLAIVTDALTFSRAGLAGGVAGAAIAAGMLFAARRAGAPLSRRLAWALGALLAAMGALAWRAGVAARFLSADDIHRGNGLATRSELWTAAAALWKTDPGLGVGAGNYELLLPQAGLVGVRTHANSLYLQALAEGGVLLFAAVVWTQISAIALALRDARRSSYLLAFGAGSCGFALHQIFDFLTFFPKVGTLWWGLLGLAVARIAALHGEARA